VLEGKRNFRGRRGCGNVESAKSALPTFPQPLLLASIPKDTTFLLLPPDDPSNPTVNFRGERRSNRTHESKTDPDAKLARRAMARRPS
jgi:hypothetical protein